MNKTITIVVSLVVVGIALYVVRQGTQDARNKRAIERIYSGDKVRPGSNVGTRPRSTDGAKQGGATRRRH